MKSKILCFLTYDTVECPGGVVEDVNPDDHEGLDGDDGAPELPTQLAVHLTKGCVIIKKADFSSYDIL